MVKFQTLQHLPTPGTNVAFPFGRLTCVLSALPTSPWSNCPRNRPHPPAPALSGRLQCGWCLFFVGFRIVAFAETFFQWICDFIYSFRWQKGDRPDNDLRWAMQHPDKKKLKMCNLEFLTLEIGLACCWNVTLAIAQPQHFPWTAQNSSVCSPKTAPGQVCMKGPLNELSNLQGETPVLLWKGMILCSKESNLHCPVESCDERFPIKNFMKSENLLWQSQTCDMMSMSTRWELFPRATHSVQVLSQSQHPGQTNFPKLAATLFGLVGEIMAHKTQPSTRGHVQSWSWPCSWPHSTECKWIWTEFWHLRRAAPVKPAGPT